MYREVFPEIVSSTQNQDASTETFPLCGKLDFSSQATDDLVICPMVKNKLIALGCCIDTQWVTRDKDFENNMLYEEIFAQAQQSIDVLPNTMRKVCLKHQVDIIQADILEDEGRQKLWENLLVEITRTLNDL